MRPALLLLVLVLSGCAGSPDAATPTPATVTDEPVVSPGPSIRILPGEINVTPGRDASFLVELARFPAGEARVELAGPGVTGAAVVPMRANGTAGVFVTVEVADDAAPGEVTLAARVTGAGEPVEQANAARVRVLAAASGYAQGDVAQVVYVGRLSDDGRVFNHNDPLLGAAAFARTDDFHASTGSLTVTSDPRPSVVEGFYEGLLGMQVGESRTVAFSAEKGYGPAFRDEPEPRDEAIERVLTIPNTPQRVERETFDAHLRDTGQMPTTTYAPGFRFELVLADELWPYVVVEVEEDAVFYRFAGEVGETYTVYPFWPEGSVVVSVNDTALVMRTTPTTAPGQPITARPHWPEMTTLLSLNATDIVIRHSPPVGHTYTTAASPGAPPNEHEIVALVENEILVRTRSTNALAGRSLTFDIRVVSIDRA